MNFNKKTNELNIFSIYPIITIGIIGDVTAFQVALNLINEYFFNKNSEIINSGLENLFLIFSFSLILFLLFNMFVLFIPMSIVTSMLIRQSNKLNIQTLFLLTFIIFLILGLLINNFVDQSPLFYLEPSSDLTKLFGYIVYNKVKDYQVFIYALIGAMSFVWRIKRMEKKSQEY